MFDGVLNTPLNRNKLIHLEGSVCGVSELLFSNCCFYAWRKIKFQNQSKDLNHFFFTNVFCLCDLIRRRDIEIPSIWLDLTFHSAVAPIWTGEREACTLRSKILETVSKIVPKIKFLQKSFAPPTPPTQFLLLFRCCFENTFFFLLRKWKWVSSNYDGETHEKVLVNPNPIFAYCW